MASDTFDQAANAIGQVRNGAIKATDLFQIKISEDEGLVSYDPGFMNTASCQSKITYIDGDKGILRYRGYPIEQLAEKSTYLETAYLILYGELPTKAQLDQLFDEEVGLLQEVPNIAEAARLMHEMIIADDLVEFLTLPAYELLD